MPGSEGVDDLMNHVVSILVENHPGVLARIAGLFSRRGFNIESLAVGTTDKPEVSRMTIVINGDDYTVEQVTKQLNKLVDVIKVNVLTATDSVQRELVLFKVHITANTRSEIMQIVDIFRARIVDVSRNSMVVEITGDSSKVKAMEDLLRQFGIKELVRTGLIAIERGSKIMKSNKEE
jgi:acetolactate synthase I/III small subunit